MSENKTTIKETTSLQGKSSTLKKVILPVSILAVAVIVLVLATGIFKKPEEKPEIITTSNITKIINIEELSTFSISYKGIATVYDVSKIEFLTNVKYYVAYEATVNVGVDLSEVSVSVNAEEKEVVINLPAVQINNIDVDMNSMDFMFQKGKYDKSGVSREAYAACNDDVYNETSTQKAIFELAHQNAINIISGLVKPVVSQADSTYTVVIK